MSTPKWKDESELSAPRWYLGSPNEPRIGCGSWKGFSGQPYAAAPAGATSAATTVETSSTNARTSPTTADGFPAASPPTPAASRLPPGSELTLHLPLRVARSDVATLVAQLLAARERELHLHLPLPEVEARRHDRVPLLAHLAVHAVDLATVQQQLARPVGIVVRTVALRVLRDVQPVQPRLAVAHLRIRLLQRRLTAAQRLHLRPAQHETRLDLVREVVVVPCAAVVDDQLLGHAASVGSRRWTPSAPTTCRDCSASGSTSRTSRA